MTDTPKRGHLVVDGVSKSYGGPAVVRDVSFAVEQGEFMTLLGPSGSGKSTTLMMVGGFEEPTTGDILIDGRSVVAEPPQRRNLGIVFQSFALFPHMSVLDNVAFPLRMRRVADSERRRRAAEMLERVGLGEFAKRRPRELSGGQQQRVALARALVFEPAALLLDEPLGALAKRLRDSLQREIKEIQARLGVSILFVTHDQEEAMTMSDRIAVMTDGQIVQLGTPRDVYHHPASTFVAGFLGDTNLLACESGAADARGIAAVTFADGTRGAARAGRTSPGPARLVSVRPERLTFVDDAGGTHENVVAGRLKSSSLLGATVRCRVEALGRELTVLAVDGARLPEPGAEVRVAWAADDAQLLAEAEPQTAVPE